MGPAGSRHPSKPTRSWSDSVHPYTSQNFDEHLASSHMTAANLSTDSRERAEATPQSRACFVGKYRGWFSPPLLSRYSRTQLAHGVRAGVESPQNRIAPGIALLALIWAVPYRGTRANHYAPTFAACDRHTGLQQVLWIFPRNNADPYFGFHAQRGAYRGRDHWECW